MLAKTLSLSGAQYEADFSLYLSKMKLILCWGSFHFLSYLVRKAPLQVVVLEVKHMSPRDARFGIIIPNRYSQIFIVDTHKMFSYAKPRYGIAFGIL